MFNKVFQIESIDLTNIGIAIKVITQFLLRNFLVDEEDEFGIDTKFMAHFLDIYRSDEIYYQDSTGIVYLLLPMSCGLAIYFGGNGSLSRCKIIAQMYVTKVIE